MVASTSCALAAALFVLAPGLGLAARTVRTTKDSTGAKLVAAATDEENSMDNDTWPFSSKASSVVSQASIDANAAIFVGEKTAYEQFCSDWWAGTVRSKVYEKHGCAYGCHSLKVDCNSGPGEGIVKFEYVSGRSFGFFGSKKVMNFGAFKNQRSLADGRFLLFDRKKEGLFQTGCAEWMTQGKVAWCEGPKWSQKDDAKVPILNNGATWDISYTWLSFDDATGTFILEHDRVSGRRESDSVEVSDVKTSDLGTGIGVMGPDVEHADDSYTIGVTGFSPACLQNDEIKGTTLPIERELKCNINVYKTFPKTGNIVRSSWSTTHHKTETEKIFYA